MSQSSTFTEIDSLNSFINLIKEFASYSVIQWIYRGQPDSTYTLMPSAGRTEFPTLDMEMIQDFYSNYRNTDTDSKAFESNETFAKNIDLIFFYHWRKHAKILDSRIPEHDIDSLVYAQHNGLPTRLLDWSSNPLVALYFACSKDFDADGKVFVYLTNGFASSRNRIDQISTLSPYYPNPFHPRIRAQFGLVTIHPNPTEPLQKENLNLSTKQRIGKEYNLYELIIKKEDKKKILQQLSEIKINQFSLFCDIESLALTLVPSDTRNTKVPVTWRDRCVIKEDAPVQRLSS